MNLFEQWRKYIKEDPKYNSDQMSKIKFKKDKEAPSQNVNAKFFLDPQTLQNLIFEIPTLHKNKIAKGLGAGMYGLAYLLDNDHVFKIFSDGVQGGQDDLDKYKKMWERQQQGIATPNRNCIRNFIINRLWHCGYFIYNLFIRFFSKCYS